MGEKTKVLFTSFPILFYCVSTPAVNHCHSDSTHKLFRNQRTVTENKKKSSWKDFEMRCNNRCVPIMKNARWIHKLEMNWMRTKADAFKKNGHRQNNDRTIFPVENVLDSTNFIRFKRITSGIYFDLKM